MRVALVSCVKSKRETAAPARDLYTSALFRGLRDYAERNADRWYVLSAQYGLVEPTRVLPPYERTLNRMPAAERAEWAAGVQRQLADLLPTGTEVLMLAGERYRKDLVPFLEARGCPVEIPLQGLPLGKQLQFLNAANSAGSSGRVLESAGVTPKERPARPARADVVLRGSSTSEVQTVAALVKIVGLGLAQAKQVIDDTPTPILVALPLPAAKSKAAELRDAGVHVEIVPASADMHAGPRRDGAYISPVVRTIVSGFIWRRKTYRRLVLTFLEDGSCNETSVDFKKRTMPSRATEALGSIRSQPGPGEVKILDDGRIEKDGMTWDFYSSVPSVPT